MTFTCNQVICQRCGRNTFETSAEHLHKRPEVMNPPASAAQGAEARNLDTANVMGLEQVHRATEARPAEVAPLPACGHLRSEVLAEKCSEGEPIFQMHKCLDCRLIFRVRSSLKATGDADGR